MEIVVTEQEAIDVATKHVRDAQLDNTGVERAFFVPGQYLDPTLWVGDAWVVHFGYPPRHDDLHDELQPDPIIVTVDPTTRVAEIQCTL